jgi:hypothetical protein
VTEEITARALLDFIRTKAPKSAEEKTWMSDGWLWMQTELDEQIIHTDYEPETFNLPGGSYTPDFRHITASGLVIFVEVKATKRQKNYRDARSKLRAAAALNPMYLWYEARLGKDTWEIERIEGDAFVGEVGL